MAQVSVKVLGCGAATGTPALGCGCDVCTSGYPKNQRLRPSLLLRWKGKNILVDAGPDVRTQLLRENIHSLDGLILTHSHYDHTAGLDELRPLCRDGEIPALMSQETLAELKIRFYYLFEGSPFQALSSRFQVHLLPGRRGQAEFLGLPLQYVTYDQGGMAVNGFRLGSFAYVTDIKEWSRDLIPDLRGVEQLIVGAVAWKESKFHFTVNQAVDFARQCGARHVWLTHLSHAVDARDTDRLPEGVFFAYDGQELTVTIEDDRTETS